MSKTTEKSNENKTKSSSKANLPRIIITAVLAALTCVATMVIQVPSPTNGYVNMGDSIVLLSAFTLGPVYGALAAGIGSAMADLLSGYFMYAAATLIIKGCMGFVAGLLGLAITQKKESVKRNVIVCVIGGVAAEAIMVLGYFAFEAFVLSSGAAAAATGIVGNVIQGIFGIVASTLLVLGLSKLSIYHSIRSIFVGKKQSKESQEEA